MRPFMGGALVGASLVGTSLVAVGCSNPLTVESLEGTYTATRFMLVEVGNAMDVGGTFTMTIGADGTASGHLFVPAQPGGAQDLNVDLDGRFSVVNGSLMFSQDPNTPSGYFGTLTWSFDGGRIRGTDVTLGVVVDLRRL